MPEKLLDHQDVLAAALSAHTKAKPDERLASVMFGTFATPGGGCYWSLNFHRQVGNTKTSTHVVDQMAREAEYRKIVAEWVMTYHPNAEATS